MKAVVVGAGIGGLATAVALQRRGLEVDVLERSLEPSGGGAALSLWPNALRALDELGLGHVVRKHGVLGGDSGVRLPDGQWLARSEFGAAIRERFGDPLVIVRRQLLLETLLNELPSRAVRYGTAVHGVDPGSKGRRPSVETAYGWHEADVVLAADGIRSTIRAALFPKAAGPRYAGYTAWRMLVPTSAGDEAFETWGQPGERFAVLPLRDGQTYSYATAAVPAGTLFPEGEAHELRRRFGAWHAPVATIVSTLTDEDVLRNDIEHLPPLTALVKGRVGLLGDAAHAMTPDLGQGGCQALEDAVQLAACINTGDEDVARALQRYSQARLSRTTAVAHRSWQAGKLYKRPLVVQRAVARLMQRLPPSVVVRRLAPVVDWRPPRQGAQDDASTADR